ncbi:MAG: acyl-CoA dehydrogenase [Azonexus sp.]|jgi:alkylation response protein AidB-like acyl-CoA dehydrogenase|nr:acyl-CoA dehydrogenase [Azonexus sp.]
MNAPYYVPPLEDMRFLLEEVFDLSGVFGQPPYEEISFDIARAVLDEGGRFAAEVLGPVNARGDAVGAQFVDGEVRTAPGFIDAYRQYRDGGWVGLDLPPEYGGQGLPLVIQAGMAEMVTGSCMAFSMLPLMGRAAARLLIGHAEAALRDTVVPRLAAGEWTATICISEPQAGSDVGRTATRATPRDDGSWSLSGTKIFITFGDHDLAPQIIHMALARTPGAPVGTRGLSLFIVPKFDFAADGALGARNPAIVTSIEHKMGLKASPTCVLNFDGARGFMVGGEGNGLKTMFDMVNVMRLEAGIHGLGVGGAALAKALTYVTERLQGGNADAPPVPLVDHADIRRMIYTMRSRIEAMRAMMFETALQLDLAVTAGSAAGRATAREQAQWLLPIGKAFFTATGFEVANLAVQCFGGYGYIAEAGVEQYVRDLRVASIYEGTNGIQAFDLVVRKLLNDEGRRYGEFVARIRRDLEQHAARPDLLDIRSALADGLARLERVSAAYRALPRGQRRAAEAGAAAFLAMTGRVTSAWMWLRMAAAATGGSALHRRKRELAAFYASYLMPELLALEAQAMPGAARVDGLDAETLVSYG